MVKSPLEYFEAQDFDAVIPANAPPTPVEAAFMKRYLGIDVPSVAGDVEASQTTACCCASQSARTDVPERAPLFSAPESPVSPEAALRQEEQVQFVGFTLGEQLYTIPTVLVREVIRSVPICRLPSMPFGASGAINLRGQVMPVIRLREVLDAELPVEGEGDSFTIICRCRDRELGVLIDRVHSMYRIDCRAIRWDAAARLGLGDECIAGVFQLDEKLVPIVSMEHIAGSILCR